MSGQLGPPTISFPASEITAHVNTTAKGKLRKPPVDLEKCALMEMTQYKCDVEGGENRKTAKTVCRPILRLFRRYLANL
jgi:inner membrane protease subunit SOM1